MAAGDQMRVRAMAVTSVKPGPSVPTEIVTYRGAVYPWHCDHMGHMNVMWYVGKFDEAAWNLLLEVGLTPSYLRSKERGMAAVQASIEYLQELRAGDVVEIRSCITGLGEKAITVRQAMINGETGILAARIEVVAVHLDTRLRKSVALSATVQAAIRSRFADVVPMPSRSRTGSSPIAPC
jgi:acyl-CoA thioester hydrolase